MPYLVKWTFIFEHSGRGWTENFFRNSDTGNLYAELGPMAQYAVFRAALLGQGAFIKGLRPSIESDAAGNPVVGDSVSNLTLYFGNGQKPIDNNDDAMLCTWTNPTGSRRKQVYMRGIWQENVNADGRMVLTADFVNVFNPYVAKVLALGIGWVSRTPRQAADITNYTSTTDFRVTFTNNADVFTDAEVAAGKAIQVQVRGLNVKSKLNGGQLVIPNTRRSSTTVKPIAVFPFTSPGRMTSYTRALVLPGVPAGETRLPLSMKRVVERRPGAPLFESRGRRSAVARG